MTNENANVEAAVESAPVKKAPAVPRALYLKELKAASEAGKTMNEFSSHLYDLMDVENATDGQVVREKYVSTTRQTLTNIRGLIKKELAEAGQNEDQIAEFIDAKLPKLKDARTGGNHRTESAVDLLNALIDAATE